MRATQRLNHMSNLSQAAIEKYGDVGWAPDEAQGIALALAMLDQAILNREVREGGAEAQAVPLALPSMEETLTQRIQEQQQWIDEHGETLEGYVIRYGSMHDVTFFGDGGEAIFAADQAELQRLIAERARLRHPSQTALEES